MNVAAVVVVLISPWSLIEAVGVLPRSAVD
jgi:hypothetical protein